MLDLINKLLTKITVHRNSARPLFPSHPVFDPLPAGSPAQPHHPLFPLALDEIGIGRHVRPVHLGQVLVHDGDVGGVAAEGEASKGAVWALVLV